MKGIFIVLEGPDGSGKSTIIKHLITYLEDKNIACISTREPGGTRISELVRDIILDDDNKAMASETEALLYAASRGQHVHEKIRPAIEAGKVVLCERFVLSSLAYQGIGRGLGIERVKMINDFATGGMEPDLTLFFKVDPFISLNRKTEQMGGDRLEREGIDFHRNVYDGYLELVEMYSENIQKIDARGTIEDVFGQCIHHIDNILKGGV